MKPITRLMLAPLAGLAFGTAALAQESVTPDTVLATVGDVEITAGQVMLMRTQLPQQYQSLPAEVLFDALVDQAVNQELFSSQVTTEPQIIRDALSNERRALRAGYLLEELSQDVVTEEALRALYDETYAAAEPSREYNAAHILVTSEDEAAEIIADLEAGADFAELAQLRSTGPSGPNGGDLGWFSRGMMVPPFQAAVEALQPGEVSPPVQTQFGWHVITLRETRLAEAPPLSQVEGELAAEIQERAIETRLNELLDTVDVTRLGTSEVDPAFLNDPAFLEN